MGVGELDESLVGGSLLGGIFLGGGGRGMSKFSAGGGRGPPPPPPVGKTLDMYLLGFRSFFVSPQHALHVITSLCLKSCYSEILSCLVFSL